MKQCFKCKVTKSLDEFYAHKKMADGHLGKCKDCTKRDTASRIERMSRNPKWMDGERERCRKKIARYRSAGREHRSTSEVQATQKKWNRNNKQKRSAQSQAYRALRNGEIRRLKLCQLCRKRKAVEMHHPDYDQPLSVEWLCEQCHGLTRRK